KELAESAERTPEAWSRRARQDLGEEALSASGLEQPRPELKLKPGDIARAKEQISKIIAGDAGSGNTVSKLLAGLGSEPEQIRQTLDPNTGDPETRQTLLLALEREIDYLGEANKLPERVQRNAANDKKDAVTRYGHEKAKYPPREYAARLARAMLDGSFDYEVAGRDYYDDLPADHPHNGQHRQAARMALEASYQTETTGTVNPEAENEQLNNYLYGLHETLTTATQEMNYSAQILDQLRESLYREAVDTDMIAEDSHQLTARFDDTLRQLSGDYYNLQAIINQGDKLSPDDRSLAEHINEELRAVTIELDQLRDDPVYYRLQAIIHNADEMNLVALRGNLSNGSFDEFIRHIQTLRARLGALNESD
ncbi:MAG TPA: hypothetical protein VFL81_00910, partial [Candidatus Saccharimonadales bacterium]|nr:hypothetical protein [Candidatus Saccharimonadales bacterium]